MNESCQTKLKSQATVLEPNLRSNSHIDVSHKSPPSKSYPRNIRDQQLKSPTGSYSKEFDLKDHKNPIDSSSTKHAKWTHSQNKKGGEVVDQQKSILVTGLTKDMNREYLELFFESDQDSNGGDLDSTWPIEIDEINRRAIVTFQDHAGLYVI